MKKYAVFSCLGLGDGLIALVLSNNLRKSGGEVTTFHPFLSGLQAWFPHLPICPFPSVDALAQFDAFFVIYEKSLWMKSILEHCEKHYPLRTIVLNPIATNNRDYPYWENGKFEGRRTFVDNLVVFCERELGFQGATKENGIVIPEGILAKRCLKRVILHPTSSRPGKDWPQEKFLKVAEVLKSQGYEPLFVLSAEERKVWDLTQIDAPVINDLESLAELVCTSGCMIGNDSGIGHLASCLGVPTVTVCRSYQTAQFWRPAWAEGRICAPHAWIPNMKGLRLRDQYWKKWVRASQVLKNFHDLLA